MAAITFNLSFERRPAFYALLDCAKEIAETHGEEAAAAWAQGVLDADFDLFVRLRTDRRPTLRLIQGGR